MPTVTEIAAKLPPQPAGLWILDDEVIEILTLLELLPQGMEEPVEQVLDRLYERATWYPPELPGQTYVRTFDLKNSWQKVIVLSGDELGRVESLRPDYNLWVQSDQYQALIHQNRWHTDEQIARDEEEWATTVYDRWTQKQIDAQ